MRSKCNNCDDGWYIYVLAAVGLVFAYTIWAKEGMDMKEGILITLLTILGTVVIELIKSIKDRTVIQSTKADTADIKPKVDRMDQAFEAFKPNITKIEERTAKIDSIASAVTSFQNLKESNDKDKLNPQEVVAQIIDAYNEIGRLNKELSNVKEQFYQIHKKIRS